MGFWISVVDWTCLILECSNLYVRIWYYLLFTRNMMVEIVDWERLLNGFTIAYLTYWHFHIYCILLKIQTCCFVGIASFRNFLCAPAIPTEGNILITNLVCHMFFYLWLLLYVISLWLLLYVSVVIHDNVI